MNIKYETTDELISFLTTEYFENDIKFIKLQIEFKDCISPKPLTIKWVDNIVDVAGIWAPSFKENEIRADWGKKIVESQLTRNMPMFTLFSVSGENKFTVALSDVKNLIYLGNGVVEETGLFESEIKLFNNPMKPIKNYELIIRIDKRKINYCDSIKECRKWWDSLGNQKCNVPLESKEPIYSSWYNFHQNLNQNELLDEIKIAASLGFKTLIIDDGWQCDDNNRGYAYTGDWNVTKNKFYDFKKFVMDCHSLGVKVMLWYSVPFIGYNSLKHEVFKDMYLYDIDSYKCSVLDPRFKFVRDYLINLYKDAVLKYDLDGFKLDFIDSFYLFSTSSKDYERMDILVLEEAVDKLLKDIYLELSKIKSNILIEYRQPYIGPLVSSYGNMLRVGDCPYSANTNRREIINLRLTSANTPVHTDMIMWNMNNPIEDCYRQLYCSLFAVPQISVLLKNISSNQYIVIKKFLEYYDQNKHILIDGCLTASTPDNTYSWAKASYKNKDIVVLYSINSFCVENDITDLINLTYNSLYLDFSYKKCLIRIYDCFDNFIREIEVENDIIKLDTPNPCRINIVKR